MKKNSKSFNCHILLVLILCFILLERAFSQEVHDGTGSAGGTSTDEKKNNKGSKNTYPSDENRLDGDVLKLRVDVKGFKPVLSSGDSKKKCAPKKSKISVTREGTDSVSLRFKKVAKESEGCKNDDLVNTYTQYEIGRKDLDNYDYKRTGFEFGGLVVPFKYYLGGDKRILPSTTLAPYFGYRGLDVLGLSYVPIVSAGLGLVPVTNTEKNSTDTQPALSTAVGLMLRHKKNDSFNAGIVFGKDFLKEEYGDMDPTVTKWWLSLYFGISI